MKQGVATVADAWRPTSELERRLQDAVRSGDQEGYFRLLAESELVVPVPPDLIDDVLANEAQPTWPAQEEDGRTFVLVYSSPAAMRACLGPAYQHFLKMKFQDLAETWPDPRWWLAVDAPARGMSGVTLPTEGRLPAWFVKQIADGDVLPPQAGRADLMRVPQHVVPEPAPEPAPQPVREPFPSTDVPVAGRAVASRAPSEFTAPPPAPAPSAPPQPGQAPTPPPGGFPPADATPPAGMDPAVGSAPTAGASPTPSQSSAPGGFPPADTTPPAGMAPAAGSAPPADASPMPGPAMDAAPAGGGDIPPVGAPQSAAAPPSDATVGGSPAVPADVPEREPAADETRLDLPAITDEPADDTAQWEELQEQHRELPREQPRPEFQPANDVERGLLRAAATNDHDLFLQTLADADVLLPIPEDMDYTLRPGRPGFPWQTREVDGAVTVPVFTSPERLVEAARAAGTGTEFITLPFTAVLRYWPDHGWLLAINSGSPAGGTILAEQLPGLAAWADQRAARRMAEGFEPQNEVEQRLFDAALRRDTDAFFKVLLGAQVLVPADPDSPWGIAPDDGEFPWRPVTVHGRTAIQVFTSLKWMTDAIGTSRFVMPGFLDMVAAWPDTGWTLVLNPGTPVDATLPAEQVRALSGPPRTEPPAATAPQSISQQPAEPQPVQGPPGEPQPMQAPPAEPQPVQAPPAEPQPVQTARTEPQPVQAARAEPQPVQGPPGEPQPVQTARTEPQPMQARAEPEPATAPAPPPAPAEEPVFEPGNRIDQELYEAALGGDSDAFLRVLMAANVLVPIPHDAPLEVTPIQREFRWEAALRGDEAVQVFTSLVRLREVLPESRFVYADFRELIGSWPREDWAMLLNPGTRIGASLRGEQVRALSDWAVRVGLVQPRPESLVPPIPREASPDSTAYDVTPAQDMRSLPGGAGGYPPSDGAVREGMALEDGAAPSASQSYAAPEAASEVHAGDMPYADRPVPAALPEPEGEPVPHPTIMQKVVPHGHVGWYLEQGYDRVGGFVHPTTDVAELQTPTQLYEALGLLYGGSPFAPADEGVYVIRWPAYCPDLYRIPFGGRSEEELASWGEAGWVVEPAPFEGGGFAPGSAGSIREYKVDSVRLPYGAEMYYLGVDRSERFVAMYDPDRLAWLRPEIESAGIEGQGDHTEVAQ